MSPSSRTSRAVPPPAASSWIREDRSRPWRSKGERLPKRTGAPTRPSPALGALDESGRVAFSATLTGGSVGAGVFLYDPASEQTFAVALAGQTAPDAAGATFSEFGFVALNDAGQVAMQATLSDGSEGIFLASLAVPVPALPRPAWIGLLAVASRGDRAGRSAPPLAEIGVIAFSASVLCEECARHYASERERE